METQQLALRDIHLPESIGWWPPAIGWWLVAILIPLFCLCIYWLYKRITRKTALKTAKRLLLKIKTNKQLSEREQLQELSSLLRRVAISTSPRLEAASLTGHSWLQFLDSTVKGTPFTTGAGQILADTHYQKTPTSDLNMAAVISVCEDWIKAQKNNK